MQAGYFPQPLASAWHLRIDRPSEFPQFHAPFITPMPKLLTFLLVLGLAFLLENAAAREWEKLQNCRLAPDQYKDGDSFHVLHDGKSHIFRLYFVDCPETDTSFPNASPIRWRTSDWPTKKL